MKYYVVLAHLESDTREIVTEKPFATRLEGEIFADEQPEGDGLVAYHVLETRAARKFVKGEPLSNEEWDR